MTDRAIIKAISKIHNNIVIFFSLIIFTAAISFFLLKEGLLIERLLLPGIKVEQLYIKWNEKLSLTAKQISVTSSNTQRDDETDIKAIADALKLLKWLDAWIAHISIEQITFKEYRARFSYDFGATGHFELLGDGLDLNATLDAKEHLWVIDVNRFMDMRHRIVLQGQSVIDLLKLDAYTRLNVTIADELQMTAYIQADTSRIRFCTESNSSVSDLKSIVDIFGLPQSISQWIIDKSSGTSAELHALRGSLHYHQPQEILHTLYASATYHDVAYTVNDKIGTITAPSVDVVFEKGRLAIRPDKPEIYGISAGNSHLDIDFSNQDFYLNVYILGDIPLNQGIHSLLGNYHINLPFVQTAGTIDSNLSLTLNLHDLKELTAQGRFRVKSGIFDYESLPVDINHTTVMLDNRRVVIEDGHLAYKHILKADVKGTLDFGDQHSDLGISIIQAVFPFDDANLSLNPRTKPLKINYQLAKQEEYINVGYSEWDLAGHTLRVDAFKAPFHFSTAELTLPSLTLAYQDIASMKLKGPVDLKQQSADLDISVNSLAYDGLQMQNGPLNLNLHYDENLTITSAVPLVLGVDDDNLTIGPLSVMLAKNLVTMEQTHFRYADLFESALNGTFDIQKSQGDFLLTNPDLIQDRTGHLLSKSSAIPFVFSTPEDAVELAFPTMGLELHLENSDLDMHFADFNRTAQHSPFLKEYNLTDGAISIASKEQKDGYQFYGTVNYPYPLVVDGNKPLNEVAFTGSYRSGIGDINIDDKINIVIEDGTITIASHDIGYNATALTDFILDHQTENNETSLPNLSLVANKSFIYFAGTSRAIADTFTMSMDKKNITASFLHKQGLAIFELDDGEFYADGQNFNDEFMTSLFAASSYRGGRMLFNVAGTLEEANGVLYVEDTVIRDYKTLNNILAFINTVPSLVTFSLPNYSTKGLKVSEAYARFTHKVDKTYFESIKLDSPEVKIIGTGLTDYTQNLIDMTMTFKTDLGTTLSKIPLVGYLLLGKDGSIATTFKVTGKLDDPEITTSTVEDIAVAPFNIVKRAVTMPFWIFSSKGDDEE